jgi:hypothetical protein
MSDLLNKMTGGQIFSTIFFSILFGTGALVMVAGSVASHWRKLREKELDAALKHKMLDQGMSADDIQKVLQASS